MLALLAVATAASSAATTRGRQNETVFYRYTEPTRGNSAVLYVPGYDQPVWCRVVATGILRALSEAYDAHVVTTYDLAGQGESFAEKATVSLTERMVKTEPIARLKGQLLAMVEVAARDVGPNGTLYIAAHSYGGSLAFLLASHLPKNGVATQLVLYSAAFKAVVPGLSAKFSRAIKPFLWTVASSIPTWLARYIVYDESTLDPSFFCDTCEPILDKCLSSSFTGRVGQTVLGIQSIFDAERTIDDAPCPGKFLPTCVEYSVRDKLVDIVAVEHTKKRCPNATGAMVWRASGNAHDTLVDDAIAGVTPSPCIV
jgi:alpha-beta hydrolase superfamily lysophospholipase